MNASQGQYKFVDNFIKKLKDKDNRQIRGSSQNSKLAHKIHTFENDRSNEDVISNDQSRFTS